MKMIKLQCSHCSCQFLKRTTSDNREKSRNPNYKPYCSRFCHQNSKKYTYVIYCKSCNKQLTEKQQKQKGKFCSKTCAATYNNKYRVFDFSKPKTKFVPCQECQTKCEVSKHTKNYTCDHCIIQLPELVSKTTRLKRNLPNGKYCRFCNNALKGKRDNFCSRLCKITYDKQFCNFSEMGKNGGRVSAHRTNLRSKNEISFADYCKDQFGRENVLTNERMFDGWDADVILPELKIAILWNGPWHYKQIGNLNHLKQVQARDAIKYKKIIENGYFPYTVKDMGKENQKLVIEEFLIFLYCVFNGTLNLSRLPKTLTGKFE